MLKKIKSFFNIKIIISTNRFNESKFKDNLVNTNETKLISISFFVNQHNIYKLDYYWK